MADRAVIKRPVVLSLRDLKKYPTLADRYAATLPFSDFDAPCECSKNHDKSARYMGYCRLPNWWSRMKAKWVKRTGERWSWFSSARKIDDERGQRLGTLGYLPWEIRQKIIKALFDDDDDDHSCSQVVTDGFTDSGSCRAFFLEDRSSSFWKSFYGMRLASPSTKVEFAHYYLTKTNFMFNEPKALEAFLDQLSVHQQRLLRSITIQLFDGDLLHHETELWATVGARLPPNLVSVQFEVTGLDLRSLEIGGQWFLRERNGPPTIHHSTSIHATTILEVLGLQARRRAPRAKIGLLESQYLCNPGQERGVMVGVLHDIEPWSRNWLEWWDGDTKIELNEGDEARYVALATWTKQNTWHTLRKSSQGVV